MIIIKKLTVSFFNTAIKTWQVHLMIVETPLAAVTVISDHFL